MASRWSSEENEELRNNYDTKNSAELHQLLPGRSIDSILKRASMHGLKKLNKWTKEEEKLLKDLYPKIGGRVSEFIHRHSRNACTDKANRMGLRYNPGQWSKEEDNILIKNYPNMGKDVYKLLPGRTITACVDRARALKIKTERKRTKMSWTTEEDKLLKKFYPIMGPDVCYKLSNRTRAACSKRARNLGLRMGKY